MEYISSLFKFTKFYKNYVRSNIANEFESCVYNFIKDKSFLKMSRSGCKRYFYCNDKKVIIRLSYRSAHKLGYRSYTKTLENCMDHYVQNEYYIITVDIYDGKTYMDISPEVIGFFDALRKEDNNN